MATAEEFYGWLKASGCHLSRDGFYDLAWDDAWYAYQHFLATGDSYQLRKLDYLRLYETSFVSGMSDDDLNEMHATLRGKDCIWEVSDASDELIAEVFSEIVRRKRAAMYPARRRRANAEITRREIRKQVFERDGEKCGSCGATESLCIDHILAVANGGSNELNNLQVLCRRCNSAKGAR